MFSVVANVLLGMHLSADFAFYTLECRLEVFEGAGGSRHLGANSRKLLPNLVERAVDDHGENHETRAYRNCYDGHSGFSGFGLTFASLRSRAISAIAVSFVAIGNHSTCYLPNAGPSRTSRDPHSTHIIRAATAPIW